MPNNNGKGKQLFDINNLEQAKKLTEQMLSILNKTSSSASEYMKDGETLEKLYTQLNNISKDNLKYTNAILNSSKGRVNLLNELNNIYDDINKQFDNYVESQASINYAVQQEIDKRKQLNTLEENRQKLQNNKISLETEANKLLQDQYKKIEKIAEKEYDSMSTGQKIKAGSKDKYVSNRSNELKQTYTAEYQKLIDKTVDDAYDSGSSFTSKDLKNLSDQAFGKVTESTDKFNESLGKFDIASTAWELASKTFMAGINRVFSIFTDGLNKQSDLYEETFQNISVRTGLTSSEYINKQTNTDNQLSSMGLYDNIKVSEVQQMWQDLANTGMNQQDMFASAIDNVLTQKIVPYLDTTTKEFNILNGKLDNKFVKDIRGINQANLDIAGNNYLTQDLLQQIIDEVQPMSDEALQNLTEGSAEFTAMINKLTPIIGEDAAKSYATNLFKARNYGDQIMSSGSVSEKYDLISAMQEGINIENPEDWADYVANSVNNTQMWGNIAPGYDSTLNSIISNSLGSTVGKSSSDLRAAITLTQSGQTGTSILKSIDEQLSNNGGLDSYSNNANNDFKSGKNQTLKQKQDTSIENIATDVAGIRESIGEWSVVVETLLSGIGTIAATWLGGKFLDLLTGGKIGTWLGGMFKSGAATEGATTALSGAGGILATGGGILLGIGAANVIKGAIEGAFKKEDESNVTAEEKALEGTALEGNTAAAVLGGMANTDQASNNNFASKFGSAWNTTTRWLGVGTLGWTRDTAQINRDDLSFFREKVRTLGGGPTKDAASDALLVWTLLLASAGRLSDIDEFKNINKDQLKQMVDNSGVAPSSWDRYLNETVKDIGYLPNKTEKEDQTSIDWNALGIPYHRYGLDEVPYDGYKAVLHEGEAVLTASTANEMRSLVDEYRDTNTQIADFDVIIQGQTTAILAKMDDIISAISNKNSYTPTSSSLNSINARDERLKSSMLKMISTRQFG